MRHSRTVYEASMAEVPGDLGREGGAECGPGHIEARSSPGGAVEGRAGMTDGAMSVLGGVRRNGAVAIAAWAILFLACGEAAKPARVVVRNPDYLVARSITREADAEHTIRVELPYSGAGYGFASDATLLDLNSIDLAAVAFAGGRTSLAGEATIWLPLTPEASQRLEAWSAEHAGAYLGIFLKGKLVAAPQIKSRIGGGIPLRVAGKSEGDAVLRELRSGGSAH